MKPFFWLRVLVLLRRLTIAAESIAETQQRLLDTQESKRRPTGKPKLATVFTPSIADQNRRYSAAQEGIELGEDEND
jgi:hypothetical protein